MLLEQHQSKDSGHKASFWLRDPATAKTIVLCLAFVLMLYRGYGQKNIVLNIAYSDDRSVPASQVYLDSTGVRTHLNDKLAKLTASGYIHAT